MVMSLDDSRRDVMLRVMAVLENGTLVELKMWWWGGWEGEG
jgi:hypothetical protein